MLRLATFALWLLAAASAVFWMLKFAQAPAAPDAAGHALAITNAAGTVAADTTLIAKALGGGNAPIAASAAPVAPKVPSINSARFVLTGVVAPAQNVNSSSGLALIAIDGKPARPYRVGAQLESGVLLKEVRPRSVSLSPSMQEPAVLTLELPLKPISTGNVTPPLAYGAAAAPAPSQTAAVAPSVPPIAPNVAAAAALSAQTNTAIAVDPVAGRSLAHRLRVNSATAIGATATGTPGNN
jgi:general secretion pathway protein C